VIAADIVRRAKKSKQVISVTPEELISLMQEADKALDGDSNDDEHDALYSIREQLSDIFERPRTVNKRVARRLPNSVDDKASLHHALIHLKANKIAEPGMCGWYSGNRRAFVLRHGKAIALLRSLIGRRKC